MKPILKQPKVDTEVKRKEKEEMYRLMRVVGLNVDVPEEKERRIGFMSWVFIVLITWFGVWFVYKVLMAFERGELI